LSVPTRQLCEFSHLRLCESPLSLRPVLLLCDFLGDLSLYSLHLGLFLYSTYFYFSLRSFFSSLLSFLRHHLHFLSFRLSQSYFHFLLFLLFLHSSAPLPPLHCERNLYQSLDPLCCLPLACEKL